MPHRHGKAPATPAGTTYLVDKLDGTLYVKGLPRQLLAGWDTKTGLSLRGTRWHGVSGKEIDELAGKTAGEVADLLAGGYAPKIPAPAVRDEEWAA